MQIFYFITIVFLLILTGVFTLKIKELRNANSILKKKIRDMETLGRGLSDYKDTQEEKKGSYKNSIMEILSESGKITHREIQTRLEISETSADRYLQELEKEGKIRQKGSGRETYYVKK